MKIEDAVKYMNQVVDVEHLAEVLEAREKFRLIYAWLTDAFLATGCEQFLDLRDICKKGGEATNIELRALHTRYGISFGKAVTKQQFEEVLKRHG